MEQKLDKKNEIQERLKTFLSNNKKKFIILIITIFIIFITFFLWKDNQNKKDILISEKYIKAGLFLSNNKFEEAKNIYEDLVLSNNKFYAVLALNTILEKNLVNDKQKIFKYFTKVEKLNLSDEQKDLINFKKALYLIKLNKNDDAAELLNNLINKNSNFESVAQELISDK